MTNDARPIRLLTHVDPTFQPACLDACLRAGFEFGVVTWNRKWAFVESTLGGGAGALRLHVALQVATRVLRTGAAFPETYSTKPAFADVAISEIPRRDDDEASFDAEVLSGDPLPGPGGALFMDLRGDTTLSAFKGGNRTSEPTFAAALVAIAEDARALDASWTVFYHDYYIFGGRLPKVEHIFPKGGQCRADKFVRG